MKPLRNLRPDERELALDVLKRRDPDLADLVERHSPSELTVAQRQAIQLVIADEFIETGLQEDDEPNARGLALEDLIDRFTTGHEPKSGDPCTTD